MFLPAISKSRPMAGDVLTKGKALLFTLTIPFWIYAFKARSLSGHGYIPHKTSKPLFAASFIHCAAEAWAHKPAYPILFKTLNAGL